MLLLNWFIQVSKLLINSIHAASENSALVETALLIDSVKMSVLKSTACFCMTVLLYLARTL